MRMWSLTLPQVAATLAATLVAFDTRNPAGQRLVDNRLLNVVLQYDFTAHVEGVQRPIRPKAIYIEPFKPGSFRS
jgi:hypothetical protein